MMALHNEIKAAGELVISYIQDFLGFRKQPVKYLREIFIALALFACAGLGYVGYRWVSSSRNKTAQKAFSEYVQDYQFALQENNPQEWDRIEALFAYGASQYASSSMLPYFLMMQSEVQMRKNNMVGALDTLSRAIAKTSNPEFISMLKTKRALMKLDMPEQAQQDEGVQELISLARQDSNSYRDMALFYLGRYYWATNKLDEAQKSWQELADSQWIDKTKPSAWVREAQAMLKQLGR